MRIAKAVPFLSLFFLGAGISYLTGGSLPPCGANAPCFTIVNRVACAGLAVKSSKIAGVYLNGRLLTKGLQSDYHIESDGRGKVMVIVHMAPNTTAKPEPFK